MIRQPPQQNPNEKIPLKNLPNELVFYVDMRSRNTPSEQGYPNRSSLIRRTPGCGRFTVVGTTSGAKLSADDRILRNFQEELLIFVEEKLGKQYNHQQDYRFSPELQKETTSAPASHHRLWHPTGHRPTPRDLEVFDVCKLFDEMRVRNVVTWNTLICGLANYSGKLKSILHLGFHYFRRMVLQRVSPDYITFTNLLHTLVELDDIKIGGQLHCVVVKSGWCVDCFVKSVLVDLYVKFGLVKDAGRIFDCVIKRDVVLWNVMVFCYMLNAFGVFKLMRLEGIKGDNFTFASLLNVCCFRIM
ncbi:hypothetical protein LguiA_003231 [Lonicera macranthoides]